MEKDYGSVEVGKVADLTIVDGDPLKDIWATTNVWMVVKDGKTIDPAFTGTVNPIPSFYPYQTLAQDLEMSPLSAVQGEPHYDPSQRQGHVAVPSRPHQA